MTVERIESIEKVPLAIDYRRLYRGVALLNVAGRVAPAARIEFSLELSPFGKNEVSVGFLEATEYPLVPAIRVLKEHIQTLDRDGALP